jgi:hypothetical protein
MKKENCFICSKEKGQPPERCPGHYSNSLLIAGLAGYLVESLDGEHFTFFKEKEYAEIRQEEWEAGGLECHIHELYKSRAC